MVVEAGVGVARAECLLVLLGMSGSGGGDGDARGRGQLAEGGGCRTDRARCSSRGERDRTRYPGARTRSSVGGEGSGRVGGVDVSAGAFEEVAEAGMPLLA